MSTKIVEKMKNSPLCSVNIFEPNILESFGTLGLLLLDLIELPAPNVDIGVRSFTCCAPIFYQ